MSAGSGPQFPHLYQPLTIGALTLKNRIFSSGHDTVMVSDGMVTDQLIAYHAARAAGGVGLIIMQVAGVHETARYTSHVLMATEDACIDGYRRVAAAVKPSGCALFGQLFHPGREVMESTDGSAPVALAPSVVPNERFAVMPRALTAGLISEIVAGYGQAARRLASAGLDGVEVVASHGYLPAQFLNPRLNRRADAYGGSAGNRLRFLQEVIAQIRTVCGRDLVVGVRISADELDPSGLTSDDVAGACEVLDHDGQIDYLNVTVGTSATLAGSDHIVPTMEHNPAYVAPHSARIRALVRVPVLVAGRINQPQEAERTIACGHADACAMTRALICDPDLPVKADEGRTEEIRACIACNQACIGHFHAGYPISCIQHPETGREATYLPYPSTRHSRRVVVVGGGPGGLKAAAVAAERGHQVTLYEARPRLGGQVLLAQQLPGRAEFGGAATNLAAEAERSGVKLVLNTVVDPALIDQLEPEAVIVATGARARRPEMEIMGRPALFDAWEVIGGTPLPAGHVVVADWRGDWVGAGVARLLVERRHQVTLAVTGYYPGERIQQYVRDGFLAALARARVQVISLVRLFGADDDTAYFQHVLTGEPVLIEGISGLVLAQGSLPEDSLLQALEGSGFPVIGIGDCLAPRTVEEAVLEGLRAGCLI
jgi:2,4-dienoyl-CoA reductase-like NADH-dependent reductase (Old Yellow Enzyme family)